MSPSPTAYSPAQKTLHWLAALLVAGLVTAGLVMTGMDDGDAKNRIYELHKSFGLLVLGVLLVRTAIRLVRGAPPPVPGLPGWQVFAARATHAALYVLAIVVPLLGWAGTSACCAPVTPFGLVSFTLPIGGGMERGEAILGVHRVLALTLAGLALLHLAAALYHNFVRQDATLRRMLPGSG